MSSSQPPPGYWLASDGRWYAPDLHPDARPSAPGPYRTGISRAEIGNRSPSTHPGRPGDARRAVRSPWVWGTGLATVLMLAILIATGPGHGRPTTAQRSTSASTRGVGSAVSGALRSTPGAPAGAAVPMAAPSATSVGVTPASVAASPEAASGVGAGPPVGDVSVSQCVLDPSDAQRAVVNGTVVNHDTHMDDYTFTLTIDQGGQTVGSAVVTDDAVGSGATSPWSALGSVSAVTGAELTCSVTFVSRTSL